jgi:hypothetical protein
MQADQARAAELFQQATARDRGEFDEQALDWLREAASLAPDHPEIKVLYEKMASYTRTFRVPGDFATPAEALAAARDRDRIVLAEQTWKGPLVVNAAVDLQGAGSDKTVVECPPAEGCAITIGPDAKGARVSGIAFRHESFLADGRERFAAALVRGGGATFLDCRFSDASGHGLAVIEDAAQSFGAHFQGRRSGSLSTFGATSFFPSKPLGCYGDGGMCFTDNDALSETLGSLRLHGKGGHKYDNIRIGVNGRMAGLINTSAATSFGICRAHSTATKPPRELPIKPSR